MSKEDFNNALNHIDYDLVEEYVVEKEKMKKRAVQRRAFIRLVPVAACFVIIITLSITILPMFFEGKFDYKSEELPPVEENAPNPTITTDDNLSGDVPEDDGGNGEEIPPDNVAPVPPEVDMEGNTPEFPGSDEGTQKPGCQEPGDTGDPSVSVFYFTFVYQDVLYELQFESQNRETLLQEINEKSISEDKVGDYITIVNVYDSFIGEDIVCPIYENLGASGIIVELFDGLYFEVQ